MVKVSEWNDPRLTEAVLVWTGYGESAAPRRDSVLVEQRFGADADKWKALIESMLNDFYASKANYEAANMQEMWAMAISDFKRIHPDAPEDVTKALAWCYTFDNR